LRFRDDDVDDKNKPSLRDEDDESEEESDESEREEVPEIRVPDRWDSDRSEAKVDGYAVLEDVYGDGIEVDRRGISVVKLTDVPVGDGDIMGIEWAPSVPNQSPSCISAQWRPPKKKKGGRKVKTPVPSKVSLPAVVAFFDSPESVTIPEEIQTKLRKYAFYLFQ